MFSVSSEDSHHYSIYTSKKSTLAKTKKYIINYTASVLSNLLRTGSNTGYINSYIEGIKNIKVYYDNKPYYPEDIFYKDIKLSLYVMKEIVNFYKLFFIGDLSYILSNEKFINYNYIIVLNLSKNIHGYNRWAYDSDEIKNIIKLIRDKGITRTKYSSNKGLLYINDKSVYTKIKMILDSSHLFIDLSKLKSDIDY